MRRAPCLPPPPAQPAAAAPPAAPAQAAASRNLRHRHSRRPRPSNDRKQRQAHWWRDRAVAGRVLALAVVALALSGCATIKEYLPDNPGVVAAVALGHEEAGSAAGTEASATATVNWQIAGRQGGARASRPPCCPMRSTRRPSDGTLVAPRSGHRTQRLAHQRRPERCPPAWAPMRTLVVVGTDKGDVLAFDPDGKPEWTARVSTEVVAPPRVADGVVAVFAGDGSMHALNAADGSKKWVNQRDAPALTVRNYAGGVVNARRPVRRHGRRPAARDRHPHRHRRLGRHRRQSEGRDRTRTHRRRDRAAARRPSSRCARSRTRDASRASTSRAARSTGRATCRASPAWRRRQEHLRDRRQGRRAGARPGHRRVGVEAGPAGRAQDRRPADGRRLCRRRRRRRLPAPAVAASTAPTSAGSRPTARPRRRSPSCFLAACCGSPPAARSTRSRRSSAGSPARSPPLCSTHAAHRRAGRPAQCRQVHAVQPADQDRATRSSPTFPGSRATATTAARAPATSRISSSTPAASSPRPRPASCTRWRKQTRQAIAESRRRRVPGRRPQRPRAAGRDDRRPAAQIGPPGRAGGEQGRRTAAGAHGRRVPRAGPGRADRDFRPRTARTCAR